MMPLWNTAASAGEETSKCSKPRCCFGWKNGGKFQDSNPGRSDRIPLAMGAFLSARTGTRVNFTAGESFRKILELLFGGQLAAAWICVYRFVQQSERLELLAVPMTIVFEQPASSFG